MRAFLSPLCAVLLSAPLLPLRAGPPAASTTSCKPIVDQLAKIERDDPRPELCFGEACISPQVPASSFWQNADEPERIQRALTGYADWIGKVSEVPLRDAHASIIQIARRIGSARCVRDTYLLKKHGRYSLIESPSIERLSEEGAHCGPSFVKLLSGPVGVLIATRSGADFSVYRLGPRFELIPHCQLKQAFRAAPP